MTAIAITVPEGVTLDELDGAVVELAAEPESGYYAMDIRIPAPAE
jgi:hypothetical protein